MKEYALILVGTMLVNNFVLVKFLGLCPFMGVSKKLATATGMGLATTFVLTLSSVTAWLVNEYMLIPLGIEYLRTIAFILVIAVVVQFTETVMHKTSPALYQVLGIFLPLITTNCVGGRARSFFVTRQRSDERSGNKAPIGWWNTTSSPDCRPACGDAAINSVF